MLQSVILHLKCAFLVGMSVCVLVCETRPLPVYPIVFRHPGLPVGGKHSIFNFSHGSCQTKGVSSIINLVCVKSEEEGLGEKNPSSIFFIWTAKPSSTTRCQSYTQHLEGYITHVVSPNLMFILTTYRVVLHPSYLQKVFSFIIYKRKKRLYDSFRKKQSSWRWRTVGGAKE